MSSIQETIEVAVPITTAYNQWTQFEEFPRFMEGVREVQQLDDRRVHWVAEVGGRTKEWDALITEQRPDRIVAWEAIDGTPNGGEVTFESLGPDRTRVNVSMGFEPEGLVEKAGAALGVAKHRVHADLERFRELVESRGDASGAWRGEVSEGSPGGRADAPPTGRTDGPLGARTDGPLDDEGGSALGDPTAIR